MDGDLLTQLGVGGILVVMVLREVFGFLKPIIERRRNGSPGTNGHMPREAVAQIDELHRLMSRTDVDGTPLVFVPRSLSTAIHELAQVTAEQSKLLERLNDNVSEARREIRQQQHSVVAQGK